MEKLKLILISIFSLFLLSGCTNLQIENFHEAFINDTNVSSNFTYSSEKIEFELAIIKNETCTAHNDSFTWC